MSLQDLMLDTVSLYATGGSQDVPDGQGGVTRAAGTQTATYSGVPARIEPQRHGSGRRILSEQGDVPMTTHVVYLLPYVLQPDGTFDLTKPLSAVQVDWHVKDENGNDYVVISPPHPAVGVDAVDHLELEVTILGGAV